MNSSKKNPVHASDFGSLNCWQHGRDFFYIVRTINMEEFTVFTQTVAIHKFNDFK